MAPLLRPPPSAADVDSLPAGNAAREGAAAASACSCVSLPLYFQTYSALYSELSKLFADSWE